MSAPGPRELRSGRSRASAASGPEHSRPGRRGRAPAAARPRRRYPGDFRGTATVRYAPHPDGSPDPGEVVWTWVPYEEDHTRGKDRPVLLVGNNGRYLLGLMLTSKDHDGDAARSGDYVDIGTGQLGPAAAAQ